MPDNEELLDVVNSNGEIMDTLPRSKIHGNPALIHKVVHLLVFNKNGEIILQKRSMDKDAAPGKWDTSVGGHVNNGETVEGALKREAEEELGIKAFTPEFLYTYIHSNPHETELVFTYSCVYDKKLSFNREEIDDVRPWSMKEVIKNLKKGILSDNFEDEIIRYLNLRKSNTKGKVTIALLEERAKEKELEEKRIERYLELKANEN